MGYPLIKIASLLILCSGFFNLSLDTNIQKKIIRTHDHDIEFYIALKKQNTLLPNKEYYWFKSGEIHNSVSASGGHLLHSDYSKYSRSNQLVEKGQFNYGLKDGLWKTWYNNGKLRLIQEWRHGEHHGKYITYDSVGNKINQGFYKHNNKSGTWINYINKDTLSFQNGKIKAKNPDQEKSFLKRIFKKKDHKKKQKSSKKTDGFLKRLFKKKKAKTSNKNKA